MLTRIVTLVPPAAAVPNLPTISCCLIRRSQETCAKECLSASNCLLVTSERELGNQKQLPDSGAGVFPCGSGWLDALTCWACAAAVVSLLSVPLSSLGTAAGGEMKELVLQRWPGARQSEVGDCPWAGQQAWASLPMHTVAAETFGWEAEPLPVLFPASRCSSPWVATPSSHKVPLVQDVWGLCNVIWDFYSVANVFFWQFLPKRPRPLVSDSHTEPHHGIQEPPTSPSKRVIKIFQNQAQQPPLALRGCPSAEDPRCPQLLPYSLSLALMFIHQSPVSALQISFISNMEITIFLWYITVKYLSKSIKVSLRWPRGNHY